MGDLNKWEPLTNAVKSVGDFYGIKIEDSLIQDIGNQLINYLVTRPKYEVFPETFFVKCFDGTIKEGYLGDESSVLKLLRLRNEFPDKKATKELYEKILLKTDTQYAYCQDNNSLYNTLKPIVGRYVMRHNLHSTIVRVLNGQIEFPALQYGNSIELYDKYIKKERSLQAKKDLFIDEISKVIPLNKIRHPLFPLHYLSEIEHNKEVETIKWDWDSNQDDGHTIANMCNKINIPYYDVLYRIRQGLSLDDAVELGIKEHIKYGVVCERYGNSYRYETCGGDIVLRATNYSFAKYVEYIAKQEEKEIGIEVN